MKCPACGVPLPEGTMGEPLHMWGTLPDTEIPYEQVVVVLTFKCSVCEWEEEVDMGSMLTQEDLDATVGPSLLEDSKKHLKWLRGRLRWLQEIEDPELELDGQLQTRSAWIAETEDEVRRLVQKVEDLTKEERLYAPDSPALKEE